MTVAYQVGILGRPSGHDATLKASLLQRLADAGIEAAAIAILNEAAIAGRDRKKPFIGVFFGYTGARDTDHPMLQDLIEDSVVIVPIVPNGGAVSGTIPPRLHHINCFEARPNDPSLERLVGLILENFRLLRPDRRLFISYRRAELQAIAIQLYEKLDELGFDVFLDVRGVPPATDFQTVLWHRLADSDVVVLLDTPGFRDSRWTREELAQANATSIQILHVLWPGAPPDEKSAFSEFFILTAASFTGAAQTGPDARLKVAVVDALGTQAESLRARALAARHRYLVDNFCDQARALGHTPAVQSSRFIALPLATHHNIAVVPAVGVPSAARYQEIETAISQCGTPFQKIWLLYDERGILKTWLDHVAWLNRHLPLEAVRVSESDARIQAETP